MFRIWKRVDGCFAIYPVNSQPADIDNFYLWQYVPGFESQELAYDFLVNPTDSRNYLSMIPDGFLDNAQSESASEPEQSEPFTLTSPEPDTIEPECPETDSCATCFCEDCGTCTEHSSCNCEQCRCSNCCACTRHGDCDCSFCSNCDQCTEHGNCECSYCASCEENHQRSTCSDCGCCSRCCGGKVIAEYHSHKGTFRKCGHPSPFHTGFELEVECGNYRDREDIAGSFSVPKTFLEDDATLTNGFEIISQPLCQQCAKETLLAVSERAKQLELRSFDTSTCGFHVHISRASLSRVQLEKLNHFISADNGELLIAVARRDPREWARIVEKKRWNIAEDSESVHRYRALNLSQSRTIEFRLFKGTTNANSLVMYLEFTWAVLAFCNETSFSGLKTEDFLRFVRKNRKQYLTLYNYLTRKYDLPKFENKLVSQEQRECALSF